MKRTIILSLFVGLFALGSNAQAEEWALDNVHSSIGFKVKHLVISTTRGTFSDFEGSASFDPKDLSGMSANFTVQVASLDTDNEKRDEHLKR